jgi:hypothetical protein
MADHVKTLKRWLAAAVVTAGAGSAANAQEKQPDISLQYSQLTEREAFRFKMIGAEDATKPVGWLNWNFPSTISSTLGFDTAPRTFCIEPLIPVNPGTIYGFNLDKFGTPKDFSGLTNDAEGEAAAVKRAGYVRELYGRYYDDLVADPSIAPAFQTALWELVGETEMPKANEAFSLFSGTFQANYANEAAAPQYVATAQTYLQGLTGDDSSFSTNPDLAGMELIRLTGVPTNGTVAAQSQLALRQTGGVSSNNAPFGLAPQLGSSGTIGGLGGGLIGGIGNRLPAGGGGFGGGLGGGGFGGGFFPPGGGTNINTDSQNPSPPNPISPVPPTPPTPPVPPVPPGPPVPPDPVPPTPPVPPVPPTPPTPPVPPGPPVPPTPPTPPVPPPPGPPVPPTPPTPPVPPPPGPDPIPAPPAAVLAVIAAGLFAVRKMTKRGTATVDNADQA